MEIYEQVSNLIQANQSFAIATVTKVEGSAPGKVGFKILVMTDGNTMGTVGGGEIERHIIEECRARLSSGESGSHNYLLSGQAKASKDVTVIPMSCSGRIAVFYEVHGKQPTVYVFGGGHVGQALLYHLKPLAYHTVLIDNRKEFANSAKNPDADIIHFADYKEYADSFDTIENSFVVILTHGHKYDSKILNILYKRNLSFPYIGIIASKTKAAGILKNLRAEHGQDIDTSCIYTPIGLKIGGTTAAEIALAISAEMQSVRYSKTLIDGDKVVP